MSQTEQGLCIADLSPNCSNRMPTVGRNYCLYPRVCQCHSLGQIAPILGNVWNLSFGPFIFVAEVPVSLQSNSSTGELIKKIVEQDKKKHQIRNNINQSQSACNGTDKFNLVSGCHRFKTTGTGKQKGILCFISHDGESQTRAPSSHSNRPQHYVPELKPRK